MELPPEEKRRIYEEESAWLEPVEKPKKDTRHDFRGMLVLVVILLIGALAWGAVTQTRLSNSQASLSTTKANLANTQTELVSTQTDLTNSEATLTDTQNNLSQVQAQLTDIKSKFPAHEFASVSDLQNWVNAHVQPNVSYVYQYYAEGLIAQEHAAQDGYIVGVEAFWDSGTKIYYVELTATVNGTLYFWAPSQTVLYEANTYYYVTYFQRQDSLLLPKSY